MDAKSSSQCSLCKKDVKLDDCVRHCEKGVFHRLCLNEWNQKVTEGLNLLTWREVVEMDRRCPECKKLMTNDTLTALLMKEYDNFLEVTIERERMQQSETERKKKKFTLGKYWDKREYKMSCCHAVIDRFRVAKTLVNEKDEAFIRCPNCKLPLSLSDLYRIKGLKVLKGIKPAAFCTSCGECGPENMYRHVHCAHSRCEDCETFRIPCNFCILSKLTS